MTSPLLRLFAVLWWVLVLCVAPVAIHFHAPKMLAILLLFALVTIIRWIVTACWRFGPRW